MKLHDRILLFDGVCRLCSGWSLFIIRFDRNKVFKLAPLQSDAGQELLKHFQIDTVSFETMFLVEGNQVYEKSSAVLKTLRRLPFPWYLLYAFIIVPPVLRDWIYDRVARNRYRLFGKLDTCYLPKSDQTDRFL